MKEAIVSIHDKQYHVREGDQLSIDSLGVSQGKVIPADQVLYYSDGRKISIGTPYVKDIEVALEVLENSKSKKVEVRRFRAKSRYRRHHGHRQPQSLVRVKSIEQREVKE